MARKEGQESGWGCLIQLGSWWLGLCFDLKQTLPCTGSMCRSTWGPRGSALQGGSEPDTGRLQFAAAGHSFRGMLHLEGLHL